MDDELFSEAGSKKRIIVFASIIFLAFFFAFIFVIMSLRGKQSGFEVEKAREQIQKQSQSQIPTSESQNEKETSDLPNQIDSANQNTTQDNGQSSTKQDQGKSGTLQTGDQVTEGQTNRGGPSLSIEQQMTSNTSSRDVPKVKFDRYQITTPLPQLPATVYSYQLKDNFTKDDALSLAGRFGMNPESFETQNDFMILTDNSNTDSNGFLSLHKYSGAFSFLSGGHHFANISSDDPVDIAKQYISEIGFTDPEIQVTATYQKTSSPGVTFVEAHWIDTKTNLTNMEVVSTLNLDTKIPLNTLKTGVVNESAIADPTILNASDGGNGKERPNQYNSITIGVNNNSGEIIAVTSSLRHKLSSKDQLSAQYLITPQEALSRAQRGQTEFSLVLPQGVGFIDINKVTPTDVVIGQNATLTDFILSYIDKTPDRKHDEYRPYYLFRGNGEVSGYQVSFVQLVNATRQTLSTASVLGSQTDTGPVDTKVTNNERNSSLQYGTIEFVNSPTLPPENPPSGQCPFFTNCYKPKDLCGKVCFYPSTFAEAKKEGDLGRSWYYIPCDNESLQVDQTTKNKWFQARTQALSACNPPNASTCPVPSDLKRAVAERCYHITTASPFIYFYNQPVVDNLTVSVSPFGGATYVDPLFDDVNKQAWNISKRESVYYEFDSDKVLPKIKSGHDSSLGFKVAKVNLINFISSQLSVNLGLNKKETEGLLAEVKRELPNLPNGLIKVSLVEGDLLTKYLPITVNQKPKSINRIMLYLTPTSQKEKVTPPRLTPVTRLGFSIIEVGVMVDPILQF